MNEHSSAAFDISFLEKQPLSSQKKIREHIRHHLDRKFRLIV